MRGLGHLPEGRGIFQNLSVKENLELGLGLRSDGAGAIRRDRDRLLDLLPALAEKIGEQASSLSGGQQQMLALARAMITRPKLLMIDELSFGLAPNLVDQLFELVVDCGARGDHLLAGGAERRGAGGIRPHLCAADREQRHQRGVF